MKVICLAENTSRDSRFGCEHGLSFYVEARGRRLLFDTGAGKLFSENARKLGVPVADVETAVISHGHNDHAGGLACFLEENAAALVYVRREAFEDYYSERQGGIRYIGLAKELKNHPRIVRVDEKVLEIGDGVVLFSTPPGRGPALLTNANLKQLRDGQMAPDRFLHEQSMIVEEDGRHVLFAGCAHGGILNIMDRCVRIFGRSPDAVVGGFHLSSPAGMAADTAYLKELAENLMKYQSVFYTCHCTGHKAFLKLRELMGGRMNEVCSGDILNF